MSSGALYYSEVFQLFTYLFSGSLVVVTGLGSLLMAIK